MWGKLTFLAVIVMATIGIARAEGLDLIETRQAGQDLLSGDFAGIRGVVAAKGDIKKLGAPAKAMARWMRNFPDMFPKGTEQGHNTRALPAIWSDPPGFRKAADNLSNAAAKLAELAKAGDAEAVTTQVKAVADACDECHRTYRQR